MKHRTGQARPQDKISDGERLKFKVVYLIVCSYFSLYLIYSLCVYV